MTMHYTFYDHILPVLLWIGGFLMLTMLLRYLYSLLLPESDATILRDLRRMLLMGMGIFWTLSLLLFTDLIFLEPVTWEGKVTQKLVGSDVERPYYYVAIEDEGVLTTLDAQVFESMHPGRHYRIELTPMLERIHLIVETDGP